MKKNFVLPIILLGILVIALGVAFSISGTQKTQQAFLEKYGLAGLEVTAIVHKLDSRTDEPKELFSSITGENLILKDSNTTVQLALPKNQFYLSFAPYENSTHPCAMHSPSSCRGELVKVPVHATITDKAGEVILDEDLQTMENGFVGVWLPKGINANIQVTYNGKVAAADISTFANSETCLTTPLKLN